MRVETVDMGFEGCSQMGYGDGDGTGWMTEYRLSNLG